MHHTDLGVEDIGVDWLIEVVFMSFFVEEVKSIFEHLIDGGLATSSGPHTHEPVTHQHGLIELDHFLYLC